MVARSWSSSQQYRYGQGTQEKDTDISEGIYTALYWEYDSRLGRRWNLDPKPQVNISDYACFGNNPIYNIDILGNKFTKQAKQEIKAYKSSLKAMEKADRASLKEYLSKQMNDGSYIPEVKEKINYLQNRLSEYKQIKKELGVLKRSDDIYNIYQEANSEKLPAGAEGLTYFNDKTGHIDILLGEPTNFSRMSILAHELKHAYQYEVGRTNFLTYSDAEFAKLEARFGIEKDKQYTGGALYDRTDEVEAFERTYFVEKQEQTLIQIKQQVDIWYQLVPAQDANMGNTNPNIIIQEMESYNKTRVGAITIIKGWRKYINLNR
jgi:hypothetical protein